MITVYCGSSVVCRDSFHGHDLVSRPATRQPRLIQYWAVFVQLILSSNSSDTHTRLLSVITIFITLSEKGLNIKVPFIQSIIYTKTA